MIFVTVGTHEQPFDRLIREIERLVASGAITEEVFVQRGMATAAPSCCSSEELISYPDMVRYVREARIVITHGGPGSIMLPLSAGKRPLVVPRQARYGEHVDDHQVAFARMLAAAGRISMVLDIADLEKELARFDDQGEAARPPVSLAKGVQGLVERLTAYCRSIDTMKRHNRSVTR